MLQRAAEAVELGDHNVRGRTGDGSRAGRPRPPLLPRAEALRTAKSSVADYRPLVLNVLIAERDQLWCFPERAYIARRGPDRRAGNYASAARPPGAITSAAPPGRDRSCWGHSRQQQTTERNSKQAGH